MRAGAADYILKDDLRRLVPTVEREARYRALYDESPAGVILYDDALRITECNERLAAISGVRRETLRGMDLGAIRSPQMVKALCRARGRRRVRRPAAGGGGAGCRRRGGRERPRCTAPPLPHRRARSLRERQRGARPVPV